MMFALWARMSSMSIDSLAAYGRELVGEEHVARRGEFVEDVEPVWLAEVEPDALLAAVRVLEQGVHVGRHQDDARRGDAAHRVATGHVLDLDHLGAEVGDRGHAAGTNVCSATSRIRTPSKIFVMCPSRVR